MILNFTEITEKNHANRPEVDSYYLAMAHIVSLRATCARRKVGCILVDTNGKILSTGYNGVPNNFPHCTDNSNCLGVNNAPGQSGDLCQSIHAEQNALIQCKNIHDIHTIYITDSPCFTCTKMLLNLLNAKRIVFDREYPSEQSKFFWEKVFREWSQVKPYEIK